MSANLLEHINYTDAKLSDLDNIFKLESNSYDHPWTIGTVSYTHLTLPTN